jgi:nucleotide-binding universal stress UspA family protein
MGTDSTVETRFIEADDVADGIVEESENFDLVVVGATREGLLQQLVFGSIPEEVGKRAEGAVIMAKRNLGVRSRLRRTLDRLR